MSVDRREIDDLKLRVTEAERQLSRIMSGLKIGLGLVVLLVLSVLIPPIGLALVGILVLGILFAYMYGVAWAAERLTRAVGGEAPRTDHYE